MEGEERYFEDKKLFIARTNKVWKELSDAEKHLFMNAPPPPPPKNYIGFFFGSKTPKASPTTSVQTEIKFSSSAAASSSTITTPTVNAHVAVENRERFLNEKENDMLNKFITKLKVSFEQLYIDDVRNDQNIMGFLKIFLYKQEVFKVLRYPYEGSETRDNRKSGLQRKLGGIDDAIIKIKKLFSEICQISNQLRGLVVSTFQLSQSYLKTSETLMNSLTSLGAFKDKITDPDDKILQTANCMINYHLGFLISIKRGLAL